MRVITLILIFTGIRLFAQHPLDQVIPELKCQATLEACLKKIESQSSVRFSYKQQTIGNLSTNLNFEASSIKNIITEICDFYSLKFEVFDSVHILLSRPTVTVKPMVGIVLDGSNGEVIQEAYITIPGSGKSTLTDKHGVFRFWIETDSFYIAIDKEGYQISTGKLGLGEYRYFIFKLEPLVDFSPVVIRSGDSSIPYLSSKPYTQIDPSALKIAGVGGENDALSNINLKSGIQNIGLGDPGLIVRGGGPDQNFVLIDGIPVYNTFHLLGLYSIFNSSTINGIKLYKDAFPSKYGSRLSSVVDVSLNDGNKNRLSGDADIGIISSGFSLSGPLIKEKMSFSLSARRTYADILTYPVQNFLNKNQLQKNTTALWYYDVFAKIHYRINPKNEVRLTLYNGGDELNFSTKLSIVDDINAEEETSGDLKWRNKLAGLNWYHMFNEQLSMSIQSAYSSYQVEFQDKYNFTQGVNFQNNETNYYTGLSEIRNTIDFDLFSENSNHVLFGGGWVHYDFEPFRQTYINQNNVRSTDTSVNSAKYVSNEYYAYFEENIYVKTGLVSVGLRFSNFNTGARNYVVLQPRIFVTKNLNKHFQVRFSITDIGQFLHLLPNNNLGLPVDIWLPVTDEIEPLRSFQLSTGLKAVYGYTEISGGLFAKNYRNLLEHKEGADFLLGGSDWKDELNVGAGSSYGFEVSGSRSKKKTQIIGSYTFCRSTRTFLEINGGGSYFSKYDRPHNIRLFGRYNFDENHSFSFSFTYSSGNPVTVPTARYVTMINGKEVVVEEFDEINNFRLPATHHLDVAYNIRKVRKKTRSDLTIGIYNIYNQLNPFMVYIGLDETAKPVMKLRSYLPMMPMLKYSISF